MPTESHLTNSGLFTPLSFRRGPAMKNRFMLAPMTTQQSRPDGVLSDEELHWLSLRAKGGFGMVLTCAAHVQVQGQGFPGQLGVFDDEHIPGLARLASSIKAAGSVAAVQLFHAGFRTPQGLVAQPVTVCDGVAAAARGLTTKEVEQLVEDFVAAARRAELAGFDGVELHGAHGYILAQFLCAKSNRRDDRYGGSLENRSRLTFEIIEGIRSRCGSNFQLGLRLSPEGWGMQLTETVEVAKRAMREGGIDYLDVSLWDVLDEPAEEAFRGRPLRSYFTEIDRGGVRLGVAGKIASAATAARMLESGADYVSIGQAAILHHDFPERARDPAFVQMPTPVPVERLRPEGVSPAFVDFLREHDLKVVT
jgi:2,4-dienoyl-CoA reductase-like NADH-dependent reductase (Old Yellow Enzyme family)